MTSLKFDKSNAVILSCLHLTISGKWVKKHITQYIFFDLIHRGRNSVPKPCFLRQIIKELVLYPNLQHLHDLLYSFTINRNSIDLSECIHRCIYFYFIYLGDLLMLVWEYNPVFDETDEEMHDHLSEPLQTNEAW